MKKTLKEFARRKFPNLVFLYHEVRSRRGSLRRIAKRTPHGFQFVGHEMMERGTFEPFETTFIQQHVRDGYVFVDVGANAGYFVCLARTAGGRVLAIEPLQANLQLLMQNLLLNGLEGVEIYPVAVSAAPGVLEIYGDGTGASLVAQWSGASPVWRRAVPVLPLDAVVGERFPGERMLVKMDVEGAEFEALLGAKRLLAREPAPVWLVEVNLTEHHPSGLNPRYEDVFSLFWEAGYQARTADEEAKPVGREDIRRWVFQGRRDFGGINFVFERD